MHVADQVEVPVDQHGVRLRFVDGVVRVEHGPDGGAVDLAHHAGGLFERQDHVALGRGQRFDQHRDAALLGVRRDAGQTLDVVAGGLVAGESRRSRRAAPASRRP